MTRIEIVYGGKPYSLADRSIESLQDEVGSAVASGSPHWLRVNSGEGRTEDAYLLISPGVPFAVVSVKQNHGNGNGLNAEDANQSFNPEVV